MRYLFKLALPVLLIGIMTACNPTVKPEELPQSIRAGNVYFTQVAMHFQKDHVSSTNYRAGELLPVNTRMRFLEMKKKYFIAEEVATMRQLKFSNNQSHTHETIEQSFEKLLGAQPVNLDHFNEMEQKNIKKGIPEIGMSKAAVLIARGYPPAIGTSSLDSNQWKYWWNVNTTNLVEFNDDRVINITDAVRE